MTREGTEVADVTPQIFGFKRDGRGEEETFEAGGGRRREGCIFYGRPPPSFGRVGRRSPLREKVEKRTGREDFLPFLFWKKGERGVRERKNGKKEKNIILPSARIKLAYRLQTVGGKEE